ncbi:hypothetical protein P7K49_012878 [Saguinus oedipus]|uniref:Uncharacterized protein n=1 Tax=Saguinus oedipus TaxID=9490 RepID=A0ABQ9VEE7_SAGOE|nr:hypothetical protein P7K49_012878 [Saguinus oedipus]
MSHHNLMVFSLGTESHLPYPLQPVELLPIEEWSKQRLPKEPTSAATLGLQKVCLWPQTDLEKQHCHSPLPSTVPDAYVTPRKLSIPTPSNPGLSSNCTMSVAPSRPSSSTHQQHLGA